MYKPVMISIFLRFFTLTVFFLSTFHTGLTSQTVTISGTIPNCQNLPVVVTGASNFVALTNSAGFYNIQVPSGGSYAVKPVYNGSLNLDLNGVTTFDAVLLTQHLDGSSPLNSPYQIIAGDVDGSQSITLQDTAIMRTLILGIITEFPIPEWCFVPQSHVFPDPQHPFPYPEQVVFTNLTTDQTDVDFVPIKRGDLNGSAVGNPWDFMGGLSLASLLRGHVAVDQNANCQVDANETPLFHWVIQATNVNSTYSATSDANGLYQMWVPEDRKSVV